jgi:hypothetical protein
MSYPLEIEGIKGKEITVVPGGFARVPKLLVNGRPAPKGPRRFTYRLRGDDGLKTLVRFQIKFGDPVPVVFIDDRKVELVPGFKFYQVFWSAWPLLLIFVGGFLGGALGGLAFYLNMNVFRWDVREWEKYLLTACVSITTVLVFALLLFGITTLLVNS